MLHHPEYWITAGQKIILSLPRNELRLDPPPPNPHSGKDFPLHRSVQTICGALPTSYAVGNVAEQAHRGPSLRMSGSVRSRPLRVLPALAVTTRAVCI